MSTHQPPPEGEFEHDAVTFLPVDRSKASEPVYSATDLRESKALGGMPLKKPQTVLSSNALTKPTAEQVQQACQRVVAGQSVYRSLLFIGRIRAEDVLLLWDATQDEEIRARWERLWVLAPFLARLARQAGAQKALLAALLDDLPGLHLLSKFAEQDNPAVKKLYARLSPQLLTALLEQLAQPGNPARRSNLLIGIIATLASQEEALRAAMPPKLPEQQREQLLEMLYIRYSRAAHTQLSSSTLKEKLKSWRR